MRSMVEGDCRKLGLTLESPSTNRCAVGPPPPMGEELPRTVTAPYPAASPPSVPGAP
jgi:hypothetical protein